jgi:4-alpha-glucanotransferase
MKILQFAFSAQEAESSGMNNPFLPHRYPEHCVCYTGTHDNDTSQGWLLSLSKSPEGIKTLSLVAQYLFGRNFGDKEIELMLQNGELAKKMIVSAISSPAFMSIIPMQDILFLDSSARMNMPSTTGKNWCWRMSGESFSDASSYLEQFISREELKNLNFIYGRS